MPSIAGRVIFVPRRTLKKVFDVLIFIIAIRNVFKKNKEKTPDNEGDGESEHLHDIRNATAPAAFFSARDVSGPGVVALLGIGLSCALTGPLLCHLVTQFL